MITIISATNRRDSNTLKVSLEYQRLLSLKKVSSQLLSFLDFPQEVWRHMLYEEDNTAFEALQEKYFFHCPKFIFILPEYNGSFPGILKTFIDASDRKRAFYGKKALFAGVATGRSGNVRGMDHLTGILNYLRVNVHWNKLPISKVDQELNTEGRFYRAETLKVIDHQLEEFIAF